MRDAAAAIWAIVAEASRVAAMGVGGGVVATAERASEDGAACSAKSSSGDASDACLSPELKVVADAICARIGAVAVARMSAFTPFGGGGASASGALGSPSRGAASVASRTMALSAAGADWAAAVSGSA